MRYGILGTLFRALVPIAVVLTALTASADGPPTTGTPSANQLQQAHNLGRDIAGTHYHAEESPFTPRPQDDLLRYRLDDYLKGEGARLSPAEKEVFTEAYWAQVEKEGNRGGMTQIAPPNLSGPGGPTTTNVSGKTATPGPGTLQLTDEKGNTYFVDVDKNGNYSATVPASNFQPTKMTLRTGTVKAAWEQDSAGKWTQVSGVVGSSDTQGAMAPGRGSAQFAGQQVAFVDECKPYALVGAISQDSGYAVAQPSRPLQSPWLLPVRFTTGLRPAYPNPAHPFARLVSDPLPPDVVRNAQKQGIDHADQQFEKSQLEKIPRGSRTKEQTERLDKLNDMLKDYDNAKNSPFADKAAIDIAEKAAAARRLQRQAAELRASGQTQTANALDAQAQALHGGQSLPPLRAGAQEPLQWPEASGGATGAMAPMTPGVPTSAATIGQQTTLVIKGTARMGSGVAIPRGTLVSGAMIFPHETPEKFVATTAIEPPRPDMTTGVAAPPLTWATTDANPPTTALVGVNGQYQFEYKAGVNYGLSHSWQVGLDYDYKTAISSGYNYGCGKSSGKTLTSGTPIPPIVIEDRSQLIKGLMPGTDLWKIDDAFKQHGLGSVEGWDLYHSPFNPALFAAYKIAEADVPKFNEIAPWHFSTFGPNYGITTAPAPAWKPENWPTAHPRGIPTARVARKGGQP